MNDIKGAVYWITGLSGAGKTTIGSLLYEKLRKGKPNVFLLDGDIGRKAYNDTIGYSIKDREEGAYRNARVCRMLAAQGIDVVCCTVSMFHGVRRWNRENIPRYMEIFLDVPMDVLIRRDSKGLYAKAGRGEAHDVWGIDLSPELPDSPDVHIINDGRITPEEAAEDIWKRIKGEHEDGYEVVVDFISSDCYGVL